MFDYDLRFMNGDAFLRNWEDYRSMLRKMLQDKYISDQFTTSWCDDVNDLSILLKLLPYRVSNKKNTPRLSFNESISKLIVFRKVKFVIHIFESMNVNIIIFFKQIGCGRNELIQSSNNYPYIIAHGESEKDISNYFIEVERHIMNVS